MLWTPSSVNHRIRPWRDGRSGLHAKESSVLGVKSWLWRAGESCWRNIPSREQGTYNNHYPTKSTLWIWGQKNISRQMHSLFSLSALLSSGWWCFKDTANKKKIGLVGQDCNSSYSRSLDRSIKSSMISWAVETQVLKNLLQIWLHKQDQANQHSVTEVGGIHGPTAIAGELLATDGFWKEGRERDRFSKSLVTGRSRMPQSRSPHSGAGKSPNKIKVSPRQKKIEKKKMFCNWEGRSWKKKDYIQNVQKSNVSILQN